MGSVLYMGGGTCAGKTTRARELASERRCGLMSVDDHLGEYAAAGVEAGARICSKHAKMSMPEFWMRDPALQCEELIEFYHEIFPYVMADVEHEAQGGGQLVAEGIAFLPELLTEAGVADEECVFMIAPREAHDARYRERAWADLMLEGCEDHDRAFELWMERDELFSQHVRREAMRAGYRIVDSDLS